jgi:2-polyprenyl-3-methyl-5-hydroxy-6-metoxy-1,4-benzoquinol methylase
LDPVRESEEELSACDGYAAWASYYDKNGNPLIRLEGPVVAALCGPVAAIRVLDLGCGTGRHTLALAEAGAQVTALDQSSSRAIAFPGQNVRFGRGGLGGRACC